MRADRQKLGLTIRQHERRDLRLHAEFVVDEIHRSQVRFAPTSSATEPFVSPGYSTDVSPGGMSLVTRQFVPRGCEGTVHVFHPAARESADGKEAIREIAFNHRVRVRRVAMHSHEPEYALGVALVDPAPDVEQRLEQLIQLYAAHAKQEASS